VGNPGCRHGNCHFSWVKNSLWPSDTPSGSGGSALRYRRIGNERKEERRLKGDWAPNDFGGRDVALESIDRVTLLGGPSSGSHHGHSARRPDFRHKLRLATDVSRASIAETTGTMNPSCETMSTLSETELN
jgi:hypothetical protein